MKAIQWASAGFSCLLFVASCSQSASSPKNAIVGSWEEVTRGKAAVDFSKDGLITVKANDKPQEAGLVGNYRFIDENNIEFTLRSNKPGTWWSPFWLGSTNTSEVSELTGGGSKTYKAKVSVSKDELSLTVGSAEQATFKRR